MFEQADDLLVDWISNVLGPVTVSLDPPADSPEGKGVSLYLLGVIDSPPLRSIKRAPLQLRLRYLVTTWAEEPREAHRMLGELTFAALGHEEILADLAPVAPELWQAFGVAPRPGILLHVPVRQERPEPPTELVRVPLVLQVSPGVSLSGMLVGPEDIPLAGAWVELTSLHLTTHTDSRGRFAFENVPSEGGPQRLRIRVKGREFVVEVERSTEEKEPLVIRFDPRDERE